VRRNPKVASEHARPGAIGYLTVVLLVEGCASLPASRPVEVTHESTGNSGIRSSDGTLIGQGSDHIAVAQSSGHNVAPPSGQKQHVPHKSDSSQNSSSTNPTWSDVGKRSAAELACWLTFPICFPAVILTGVYQVGKETVTTYRRRHPDSQ
jgi:hypothetical protein